ncbi:MAG TPA: DUF3307 domain-containing protein [Bdellovibrionales bacterium]|nr:DUF3307 domain-containing protein [Bdellovibrionales bacterium]
MNVNAELLLILLIFFQVKHFVADFLLQNVWMLQKARPNWDFVLPLALHSGVHAVTTLAVALYIHPSLWWLGGVDFVVHFLMDRIKAGPRYLGRFTDVRSKAFWVSFGLDQMVHHLTHIYICWVLASV